MTATDCWMRIIKKKAVRAQFARYPDVEGPLKAWVADVADADWAGPQDLKQRFPKASILEDNRFVFDIKGNQYRLIVYIFFPARLVYIKFFGTHAEYDKVDATTVDDFSSF
jgi:mRNA interferase HigB